MKKITTLFVFLTALTLMSQAQLINPITIDSARTNDANGVPVDTGVRVTLMGTVYGVNSYKYAGGVIFTLNDGVAGIKVYATHNFGYTTVHEGDSVMVTGKLAFYKGEEEIDPSRTVAGDTILYIAASKMDTTVVTTIVEANESQLIELENVNMTTATGWGIQQGYSNFTVHPIGTSYSIYIDSFVSPALFESAALTGMYNIIGIGAQFKSAAPFATGYQIVPRYPSDFQSLSANGIKNVEGKLTAVVYPNPASTKVMVSLMNDREETLTAQLIDITGRVVMSETKTVTNGENNLEFNTANVTNGMYVLELRTAEKYLNTKVTVAK